MGTGPCHVALDSKGRVAIVANYGSGSIASYKIGTDGHLSEALSFFQDTGYGPNTARQVRPARALQHPLRRQPLCRQLRPGNGPLEPV